MYICDIYFQVHYDTKYHRSSFCGEVWSGLITISPRSHVTQRTLVIQIHLVIQKVSLLIQTCHYCITGRFVSMGHLKTGFFISLGSGYHWKSSSLHLIEMKVSQCACVCTCVRVHSHSGCLCDACSPQAVVIPLCCVSCGRAQHLFDSSFRIHSMQPLNPRCLSRPRWV